jgi:hypothetical protein
MKARWAKLSSFSLEDFTRGILVISYGTITLICFTTSMGPRIFWTMALPLLILSVVLMGFNTWRRICPLAYWGTFGVRFRTKIKKGTPRSRMDGTRVLCHFASLSCHNARGSSCID